MAFRRAAQGKPWHGETLPVVQIEGQRGGAAGCAYAVDLSRCSPALLAKFDGLRALRDEAAATVPAPVAVRSSVEPWRAKEGQRRLDIIRPLLDTAKGSRARGKVLREIVAKTGVDVDARTLQRWLSDYESRGLIGLLPKPNGNPGKRRVEVTRAWDDGIDLDDAARAAVVAQIETYTKTMIAKGVSLAKVSRQASLELADLCRDAGSQIGPRKLGQLCRLNTKFVMRFKDKRRVARHDLDNKDHFDKDKPRISRGRCTWPMEVVYGDVHPIDIYVPVPNGKGQLRVRLIAWMDDCTHHMWATVAVLGKGNGIRATDVADALYHMVCDPAAGVPRTLYLDNGSEYGSVAKAMGEIPDAVNVLGAYGGCVKAKPYNGPAKGLIEGAFSKLEQGFLTHLPGWIGGDRTNKRTHAVGKPVKGFSGTVEDLVQAVQGMVAAYNDEPQHGRLQGKSPRQAMRDAIAAGFEAVTMDDDAFDFAFSKRDDKPIIQGRFRLKGTFYQNDETMKLGAGDRIEVRIPLRSGTDRVFVVFNGEFKGAAHADTQYHPLDREGAIESSRRANLQRQAIRDLKADIDPSIDPATEILKRVDRTPLVAEHGTIVRLSDQTDTDTTGDDDAAKRAFLEDLLRHANGDGEASRMAGGK
ncbi:helix-turn-helix domain-containing protein [Meridianimarinicoccus sp. RP-17]|uniref:helix-turn-helix domain-containing protein n=1 Tax=Meridianimarinicoccus zhengii TaxID=2056810 RepID=UPI0013A6E2A6|nr:helix-turn-helix domain-containing protein [Phycocomes zhengii]